MAFGVLELSNKICCKNTYQLKSCPTAAAATFDLICIIGLLVIGILQATSTVSWMPPCGAYAMIGVAGVMTLWDALALFLSCRMHKPELTRIVRSQNLVEQTLSVKNPIEPVDDYPANFVFDGLSKEVFDETFGPMLENLPHKHFRYQAMPIAQKDVIILAININHTPQFHFYTDEHWRTLLNGPYKDFTNMYLVDDAAKSHFAELNIPLRKKEYWPFELNENNNTYFAVAYKTIDDERKINLFLKKEERDGDRHTIAGFIKDHLNGFRNVLQSYIEINAYTKREANKLCNVQDLQTWCEKWCEENTAKKDFTPYTCNIRTRDGNGYVYVLRFREKNNNKTIFFKSNEARDSYITKSFTTHVPK